MWCWCRFPFLTTTPPSVARRLSAPVHRSTTRHNIWCSPRSPRPAMRSGPATCAFVIVHQQDFPCHRSFGGSCLRSTAHSCCAVLASYRRTTGQHAERGSLRRCKRVCPQPKSERIVATVPFDRDHDRAIRAAVHNAHAGSDTPTVIRAAPPPPETRAPLRCTPQASRALPHVHHRQ